MTRVIKEIQKSAREDAKDLIDMLDTMKHDRASLADLMADVVVENSKLVRALMPTDIELSLASVQAQEDNAIVVDSIDEAIANLIIARNRICVNQVSISLDVDGE
jgi:hypothetical protein